MDILKHWRMATATAVAALVMVAALPPRDVRTARFATGESRWAGPHGRAVETAVRRLREQVRQQARARTYRQLVRTGAAVSSTRYPLSIVAGRPVSAESLRTWLRAAEAEVDMLGDGERGASGHVVVVLHHPDSNLWGSRSYIAGEGADRLCVVEVDPQIRGWRRRQLVVEPSGRVVSRMLSSCALVAAYGWPSDGLMPWLLSSLSSWWGPGLVDRVREVRSRFEPVALEPERLGGWEDEGILSSVVCVRGNEVACRSLVGLERRSKVRRRWPSAGSYWRFSGSLIPELLADTSRAQFRSLWTSRKADVSAAMEDVYGRPAGLLAMDVMRRRVRAVGWDSRPPARVLAATAAWILLLLSAAMIGGRLRDGRV